MKKLLTIFFAISFLSVSAQYKSNYELTCVDSIYYTKANKFNPSSYECKKGIELKKPNKTKEFFKYPVQIEVDGGQVHLYDFEGNSEVFPITRTIPNSIQEVLDLVKQCNAGVDVVDDADSVIGNENTTNVSVTNVNETYTVTISNADGTTVTDTFDIELFDGVDTTDLKQLILDCVPEVTPVTNTSITYNTDSDSSVYTTIITDSEGNTIEGDLELPCFDEWTVLTNQSTIEQTTPVVGGIILSDTTQIITSYLLCGELVYRDTSMEWVQTECDGTQTCASTYKVFNNGSDPQCYFVTPNEVLEFYSDIVIYDGNGCTNAIDTNGDAITVTNGTISSSTGVNITGNTFVPNSVGWSVTITKDVGLDLILTKDDGDNMDFYVDQMLGDVAKQVVCTPTCVPPVTETTTTQPTGNTGIATASFSITKLGSPVACNECVSLIFEQSNGTLIQQFDGLTCGTLSSFTNYNSSWFPNGSETVGHNTTIQINKQQMAIDLGLNDENADSWTVYIVAGGQCPGSESKCPNPSSQNEEDYWCHITFYTFDNQVNESDVISDNGTTTTYNEYLVGGLSSISNCIKNSRFAGGCQATINEIVNGNYRVKSFTIDDISYNLNSTYESILGGNLLTWGLMFDYAVFEDYTLDLLNPNNNPTYGDPFDNGTQRCSAYGVFTACENAPVLQNFCLESDVCNGEAIFVINRQIIFDY